MVFFLLFDPLKSKENSIEILPVLNLKTRNASAFPRKSEFLSFFEFFFHKEPFSEDTARFELGYGSFLLVSFKLSVNKARGAKMTGK